MVVFVDARMMDGIVRGGLEYLRRAIENRVEQDHGAHLVAAVSLMLGGVAKMQPDVVLSCIPVNDCLAEAKAPIRVSLRQ